MPALISSLLTSLLPLIAHASNVQVGSIITTLIQLIPTVIKEATDLIGPIKNIISALNSNVTTTPEQLATLAALDAQCDTAFDTAVAADKDIAN